MDNIAQLRAAEDHLFRALRSIKDGMSYLNLTRDRLSDAAEACLTGIEDELRSATQKIKAACSAVNQEIEAMEGPSDA